ncbi:hypothetical protein [Pyruvatibacter sp.]
MSDELPEQFEDQTPITRLMHGHAIMLSALCEIIDTLSEPEEPEVQYVHDSDQLLLV